MRRKAAGILLIIGIGFASAGVMAAEEQDVSGSDVSDTDVSSSDISSYDVSISIVETQTEIKSCEYKKYEEAAEILKADINSLEEELETARQKRKKAEEAGDSLEIMRMDLVISNCIKGLEEKRKTLAEYQLQMDMDAYYIDNAKELTAEQKERNQYDCYCIRLALARYNAHLSYLKVLQAELEKRVTIENNKLKLGYATALDVSQVQSALDRTLLMIKEADEEISFQKDLLESFGEEEFDIELPQSLEELQGDIVNKFCGSSIQIKFYEQQMKAYGNYIEHSGEPEDELKKMQLQLELAELNHQQYRVELTRYVKQKEKSYRQHRLRAEEYNSEITLAEQKIRNSELLYDKGRLREIDVMELKTEKARLEYERICVICDAQQIRYILEHRIENADSSYAD